jgi:hypothetical protein
MVGKPIITQIITAPEIVDTFVADMRNSTYADMTTQGYLTWSVQLPGTEAFSYDSSQVQTSNVTAGLYKYNPAGAASGAGGTYTYSDGGYSQQAAEVDWPTLFDQSAANPRSYPGNRPAS